MIFTLQDDQNYKENMRSGINNPQYTLSITQQIFDLVSFCVLAPKISIIPFLQHVVIIMQGSFLPLGSSYFPFLRPFSQEFDNRSTRFMGHTIKMYNIHSQEKAKSFFFSFLAQNSYCTNHYVMLQSSVKYSNLLGYSSFYNSVILNTKYILVE